ncbi:MAG: NAD(P)H-dependent oxidoreductase [Rubrimonas sp.]
MRVLTLYAHPVPDSFGAAIRDAAVEGLRAGGHEVDLADLYAEGFDPVMTEAERRGYHDPAFDRGAVQPWIDRLTAAEGLMIVSPVWNFGYPAILKGFFDRVFLPRVTFTIRDGRVAPGAVRMRRLGAAHSYGASRLGALWAGDPPRRFVCGVLPRLFRPERRTRYLAIHSMNTAAAERRARFLALVRAEMTRF